MSGLVDIGVAVLLGVVLGVIVASVHGYVRLRLREGRGPRFDKERFWDIASIAVGVVIWTTAMALCVVYAIVLLAAS